MANPSGEGSDKPRPPIGKLPVELLGKIFIYAVFASCGHPFKLDRCGTNPYNITLVSRHWMAVAYSTPQLWVILPGNYPEFCEEILKRSGGLPLCLQCNMGSLVSRSGWVWPPAVLDDPDCYSRLQGLHLEHCDPRLEGSMQPIAPIPSLHMTENSSGTVSSSQGEFSTFVQRLPHLAYLRLEGCWIPSEGLTDTSTPQERFEHPNLRHLWLKGGRWSVFRFLEFASLQMLDSLEIQARFITYISENQCRQLRSVFLGFLEGRNDAARSLTLFSSGSTLNITVNCPDRRTEYGANAPFLTFTAAGFNEPTPKAWEGVVRALPRLAGVEELVLHNVELHSSDVEHLLQMVSQTKHIVATGLGAEIIIRTLRPRGVRPGGVDRLSEAPPNQRPGVAAPLLESLTLAGIVFTPQRSAGDVAAGLPNPLVECIRERYSSGHGLERLTIRDFVGLGPSEVAELSSAVDCIDVEGEVAEGTVIVPLE